MKPVSSPHPMSLRPQLKDDVSVSAPSASTSAALSTLHTRRPRRGAASASSAAPPPKRSALQAQLLARVGPKRGRTAGQVKQCTQALAATTAPRAVESKVARDMPAPVPINPDWDSAGDPWQFLEISLDAEILPENWHTDDDRPSSPVQGEGQSSRVQTLVVRQENRGGLATFAVDDGKSDGLFSTVKPMPQLELTALDWEALCDPMNLLPMLDWDGPAHDWLAYHEQLSSAALAGSQPLGVERQNDCRAGPFLPVAWDHGSILEPRGQAATDCPVAFAAEATQPDSHLDALPPLPQPKSTGPVGDDVCDPLQFLPDIPPSLPFQTEQPLSFLPNQARWPP